MRLHPILLFLLLGLSPAAAQSPPATNAPAYPRALPVNPGDLGIPQVPNGVIVHWYGHGFIYLTSSVGIKAAIDPFGAETVHYKFPDHLTADFVLITHESEDHSAAERIFGDPLVFRSVMAVGLNRANGIPFYGIALQKDPSGQGISNTAFTLSLDGVKFCYLGQINMPLLAEEKEELGHVDVVFLPVGLESLSVNDLNQIVKDLGATMVIPVNYKTDLSGILNLRSLDEYLSVTKFPVRKVNSDEIVISRALLPAAPTVYLLKSPTEAAPAPPTQ
ncbi:MAG: MBL fold metallo-hydrolase [Methylacidiphilales bacterium]|nr:MBL fold metallo-hydrolase [Candidatus Methylacidiphilales bacterium]